MHISENKIMSLGIFKFLSFDRFENPVFFPKTNLLNLILWFIGRFLNFLKIVENLPSLSDFFWFNSKNRLRKAHLVMLLRPHFSDIKSYGLRMFCF